MRYLKYAALVGVMMLLAGAMASTAMAQVRVHVGVGFGPAYGPPVCAYGYYPYYPYGCAPYGYYGSEWFVNGVFIGAGPWYHGFHRRPVFVDRERFFGRGFADRDRFRGDRRLEGRDRDRFRGREFDRGDFHGGREFRGGDRDRFREGDRFHGGGSHDGGFHGGGGHRGGHR